MKTIKGYYRITLASYAIYNDFLNNPECKWLISFTDNNKKWVRMYNIFYDHTKKHTIKYKYGVKVAWNLKETIKVIRSDSMR